MENNIPQHNPAFTKLPDAEQLKEQLAHYTAVIDDLNRRFKAVEEKMDQTIKKMDKILGRE